MCERLCALHDMMQEVAKYRSQKGLVKCVRGCVPCIT